MNVWWDKKVRSGSREISDDDLKRAAAIRLKHRKIRPLARFRDLLTGLKTNPEQFKDRNLFVWVCEHTELDEWAENALAAAQKEYRNEEMLCWQGLENPPESGSFVIEFDAATDPPSVVGISEVLFNFKSRNGETITLCQEVDDYQGLKLGPNAPWKKAAAKAAEEDGIGEWEADEFARLFL